MNSSELHRKLLFCGYKDLAEYLSNSPVNRYIYNQLIDLLPKHHIEVSIVTFFNEVYYQCVRVQYDGNPGGDLAHRYIDEEESWLGSSNAAMLVFSLVCPLIERKKQLTFNEECFLTRLVPLIEDCEFIHVAKGLKDYMVSENISSPDNFKTKTCPIKDIPMRIDLEYNTSMAWLIRILPFPSWWVKSSSIDFNPWRKVTDNFSENSIRWYVELYSSREDQLRLLERIEKACTRKEYRHHLHFFNRLKLEIRGGEFVSQSMSYTHFFVNGFSMYPNKKDERLFVASRSPLKPTSVSDLYKKKAEDAEKRCEELEKRQAMEIARMEARHQSEIQKLQKQLQRLTQEKNVTPPNSAEQKQNNPLPGGEINITISELANIVKERFTKTGAEEVCTMLYHLAMGQGPIDEETFKLIDGIVPAILNREAKRQTVVDIEDAENVYINPTVNNITKEEKQ